MFVMFCSSARRCFFFSCYCLNCKEFEIVTIIIIIIIVFITNSQLPVSLEL